MIVLAGFGRTKPDRTIDKFYYEMKIIPLLVSTSIFVFCLALSFYSLMFRSLMTRTEKYAPNFKQKTFSECSCHDIIMEITRKQSACSSNSSSVVEICLVFADDYEYLWPFLMHSLSIGFRKVHLYNNDPSRKDVYQDLGIGCLIESGFVSLKPWLGAGVQNDIQNDCFRSILNNFETNFPGRSSNHLWAANFDVDEFLVLHHFSCVSSFLDFYSDAPGVVINWAIFPPLPHNYTYLRLDHPYESKSDELLAPYHILRYRAKESVHYKTIARIICLSEWTNPHYPNYVANCSNNDATGKRYRKKAVDMLNRSLTPEKRPPNRLPNYKVAQLNHYWTYNIFHFMRKMRRGDSFYANKYFRSSSEYFQVSNKYIRNLMYDESFLLKYGDALEGFERLCPHAKKWPLVDPQHHLSFQDFQVGENLWEKSKSRYIP